MSTTDVASIRAAAWQLDEAVLQLRRAAAGTAHRGQASGDFWAGTAAAAYRAATELSAARAGSQAQRLDAMPAALLAFARTVEETETLRTAAQAATGAWALLLGDEADAAQARASTVLRRALSDALPDRGWATAHSTPAGPVWAIAGFVVKRVYPTTWQRAAIKPGWNDLKTGGGYSGARGAVTRFLGGVELLGVALLPRGGFASIAGVAAIAAWGTWKVTNVIWDHRQPVSGTPDSARRSTGPTPKHLQPALPAITCGPVPMRLTPAA